MNHEIYRGMEVKLRTFLIWQQMEAVIILMTQLIHFRFRIPTTTGQEAGVEPKGNLGATAK